MQYSRSRLEKVFEVESKQSKQSKKSKQSNKSTSSKTLHQSFLRGIGSGSGSGKTQEPVNQFEILEKLTVSSGKRPTVTFARKGVASLGIRVGARCGAKVKSFK